MTFAVITLFPRVFDDFFTSGIIGKAHQKGLIIFKLVNLRDFAKDTRKTVDDKQFGPGTGMVLKADIAAAAIEATKKLLPKPVRTILLTAAGATFNQKRAFSLTKFSSLLIFCGHYEGVDERVVNFVDEQISIGDYILTGGETAAQVVIDATSRLIPGVLPKVERGKESFSKNLLSAPVYTRPEVFRGIRIPNVLLGGNKTEIEKWRKRQQILRTKKVRPDLFEKYKSSV